MEILGITAVLLLLVAGPVIVVNRDLLFNRSARKRASREEPLPFLIFPLSDDELRIVPAGVTRPGARAAEPESVAAAAAAAAPWASADEDEREDENEDDDEEAMAPEPEFDAVPAVDAIAEPVIAEPVIARPATRDPGATERRAAAPDRAVPLPVSHERWARPGRVEQEQAAPADATIVFSRPVDEPVQILPGRLQILSGDARGEDFRLFSKIGEAPQIVVGRETGPPHRHITLHSPTVSRRHARMDFIDGNWTITNLSATNPVLVNDRILQNGSSTRKLSDGDRIELGEVALRFLAS